MHQPSAADTAAPNVVDATSRTNIPKRVIFTMGGKGGVGKTSFVSPSPSGLRIIKSQSSFWTSTPKTKLAVV